MRAARLVVSVGCAVSVAPAAAWSPETRSAMVDEAVRLMPEALRTALEGYRQDLRRGMLEPMLDEDGPAHRPPWAGGTLDSSVEREALALLESLKRPGRFGDVARRFGALAHYVSDTGFPPASAAGDPARRYAHFSAFCEDRRRRFPVVFYGHADAELEAADWRGFALREMRRAGRDDLDLARAYAAAGDPADPAAFDDRSIPFALGSMSYSRGITNIVRVWLSVWQRAGGDMERIPYFTPSTGDRGG